MHVDLRDYRFVSARQAVSEEPAYITFLLSKSPTSVYVQMTEYSPRTAKTEPVLEPEQQATEELATPEAEVTASSAEFSNFVLEGLVFETGSARLGADPNGSLAVLAGVLQQDLEMKVLLVGHSDMSGSLDRNIALSRKRAGTILNLLVKEYGIARNRLSSHGVGFLSPRASNDTESGKAENRRVEAVFFK